MKVQKRHIFQFVLLFSMLGLFQQQASATASFARATGASCNKCHTASFPRLTVKGERFMQNGFQMRKQSSGGFSLGDDESSIMSQENKFKLPPLAEMLSITGQFSPIQANSKEATPVLASPDVVTIIAAGAITKDMPFWAGIDIEPDGASVHRYQLGFTNIGDSKLINFRMGTLDPTTWTSLYGHGAALESSSSGIGSYGAGHDGETGFVAIGTGYAERNAMEYYGYTKKTIWSVGLANTSGHGSGEKNDPLDYWITTRYEFMKKSTVSFLWYNANGAIENQSFTLATNFRLRKLDFLSQFSFDNSGRKVLTDTTSKVVRDKWGFTAQSNYALTKKNIAVLRYDMTDNGEKYQSTESQLTIALIFKPVQNIKITASLVKELKAVRSSASTSESGTQSHKPSARAAGHDTPETETIADTNESTSFGDHFKINIRYMF